MGEGDSTTPISELMMQHRGIYYVDQRAIVHFAAGGGLTIRYSEERANTLGEAIEKSIDAMDQTVLHFRSGRITWNGQPGKIEWQKHLPYPQRLLSETFFNPERSAGDGQPRTIVGVTHTPGQPWRVTISGHEKKAVLEVDEQFRSAVLAKDVQFPIVEGTALQSPTKPQ